MAIKRAVRRSQELFVEAREVLVGGVASRLHKSDHGLHPIYISHGKGSKFYDVDGNEYIDYMGGFGPMVLGFSPEKVGEAVCRQIARGSQFACPTEPLNEASRKLVELIPCAERVTYQGTGTEANLGTPPGPVPSQRSTCPLVLPTACISSRLPHVPS